jgi:hypothetical protein
VISDAVGSRAPMNQNLIVEEIGFSERIFAMGSNAADLAVRYLARGKGCNDTIRKAESRGHIV